MTQKKPKILANAIKETESKLDNVSISNSDNSPKSFYNEAFEGFMKFTENENKTFDLEVKHDFYEAELFDLESPNPKLDALSALTNYFFNEKSDHPDDPENLLSSIDDCLNLLNSLEILGELIPELYQSTVNFCIKCKNNSSETNKTRLDLQFNLCKLYTLSTIQRLVEVINATAVNEGMSYEKYSLVLHSLSPSTVLIDPISTNNLQHILTRIKKVFPEIELPDLKLNKKNKPRISNKAFKLSAIEPTPNHFTCVDILTLLIKPQEFTELDYSEITKNHRNKKANGYTTLKIPKPEQVKIGDFSFTVLKCFDWKDRKILRLTFTEAVHHKGKFSMSLKWVLEQIGELKSGGKTLNEKLEDLKNRFIRYRNVILNWEYRSGKKIDESEGGIFILNWGSYYSESNDIIIEDLFLGKWFQVNKDTIKEFTRTHQKLISINTTYHWIAYAIAEKMCTLLRINKEDILKKKSAYRVPIKLSIKFLLDEILTDSEISETLQEKFKGTRLKSKIIDETKFLESHLNWQFQWVGLEDTQSFSDFYSTVSFICHVDPELESQILGEKNIKAIKPRSKLPLTIEGNLVKTLRKNLKMTQETFAKYMGYSRTLISKIERGSELASEEFIKNLYQKYALEIEKIKK